MIGVEGIGDILHAPSWSPPKAIWVLIIVTKTFTGYCECQQPLLSHPFNRIETYQRFLGVVYPAPFLLQFDDPPFCRIARAPLYPDQEIGQNDFPLIRVETEASQIQGLHQMYLNAGLGPPYGDAANLLRMVIYLLRETAMPLKTTDAGLASGVIGRFV